MKRKRTVTPLAGLAGAGLAALTLAMPARAADTDPEAIVKARCATCHERLPDGTINRIDHIRKTPEGWTMTIFRMGQIHGARVSPEETQTLVRWLADRQGLAPEETAAFRYILERRGDVVEPAVAEADLSTMCARCHSFARVGLQRRDADEWRKLVHFHLGQWPTIEYQALGRDRKWWELASTGVPDELGKRFPFRTDAWTAWQKARHADLSGTWVVTEHRPGSGTFGGTAKIAKAGDGYSVSYELAGADGKPVTGSGKAVVYTGYEWRGTVSRGSDEVREVFAANADGTRLTGRWFLADHNEVGADFTAVRADGAAPAVLGLSRDNLKAGETARLTVWGTGLDGRVDFGPGITVKPVSASATAVTVEATADAKAAPGLRPVTVGKAGGASLAVYDHVDAVKVEPAYTIARVGANGGPLPAVTAQFEAVGYIAGPSGQKDGDDAIRIGTLPATWTLEPFNDAAKTLKDVDFAGRIDGAGLFVPAAAGPNPQRPQSINNVGDLKVVATVKDGSDSITGEGHVIATVQRWNDPPIH